MRGACATELHLAETISRQRNRTRATQRRRKSRQKRRQQDNHMSRGADEGIRKKPDCDTVPRSSWAHKKHTSQTTQPTRKPTTTEELRLFRLDQDRHTERPTMGTKSFRCPLQDCALPVKGARDALRNLEGPDRLLSLAIHATTERRASDHPPPTATRVKGQKVMPALVHCEAVPRNAFFRDSTGVKMPAGRRWWWRNPMPLVPRWGLAGPRRRPASGKHQRDRAGRGPGGDHRQWGLGGSKGPVSPEQ